MQMQKKVVPLQTKRETGIKLRKNHIKIYQNGTKLYQRTLEQRNQRK